MKKSKQKAKAKARSRAKKPLAKKPGRPKMLPLVDVGPVGPEGRAITPPPGPEAA